MSPFLVPSVFLPPLPKTRHTLSPLPASVLLAHLATLEAMLPPPVYGSPSGVSPVAEAAREGMDEFERGWCREWCEGIIKRGEAWVGEVEGEDEEEERAEVVDKASTVIALMAGCSAAGSLTRTFTFTTPVDPLARLTPLLSTHVTPVPSRPPSRSAIPSRFSLPATPDLTRCSTPVVGSTPIVRPATPRSGTITPVPELALSPTEDAALELEETTLDIKLHDAAMTDHLSVGVLTWASSIFMAQAIASDPAAFFRLDDAAEVEMVGERGPRVLELGAGTGLLSIVARKMLDRIGANRERLSRASGAAASKRERRRSDAGGDDEIRAEDPENQWYGTVVATDFLPSVLDNLQKCVDINFEDESSSCRDEPPVQVLKLDWTTYPKMMAGEASACATEPAAEHDPHLLRRINNARGRIGFTQSDDDALDPVLVPPYDIILVADCVYDTTHAQLIKDSLEWALRAPVLDAAGRVIQEGGVVHLLSPLRPTYTAESASIAAAFPFEAALTSLNERRVQAKSAVEDPASALLSPARKLGFQIATKHQRELERIKGVGRADEVEYTWWQIGWA